MPIELTLIEARVLGSLVEKSLTTPELYPMTFNGLLNACNQKTSREPVMSLDVDTMGKAVESLIDKDLIERLQAAGDRVPKFRHDIGKLLGSDEPKLVGTLTVLLLRGPQTPGEIKGRTDRLCAFESTAEVEGLLQQLCAKAEHPIVARLPRRPGQKEVRYQHLFSNPSLEPQSGGTHLNSGSSEGRDRLAQLEKRVEALEAALKELTQPVAN